MSKLKTRRPTGQNPSLHTNRLQFLSLRTRTDIDRIAASVEKPKRVIPLNAPDEWRELPLTIKIPMLRFPKGMLTFTRQKVGNEIFKSKYTDFDLSDPYCHDVAYDYEPLHDQNMRNFSRKPTNLKLFQQMNLIDSNTEVLCSLKQFNNYRQYLKRQIITEMNHIGAVQDALTKDRLNYRVVEKMKKRYMNNCFKKQIRAKRNEKLRLADENRMKNLQAARKKYDELLRLHEERTLAKHREIEMESNWRQRLNNSRREDIAKAQKLRSIMLKRKFATTADQLRQRQQDKRKAIDEQRKIMKAENFAAKMEWRQFKHIHDTHLIRLNDEVSKYNQMMRKRGIDKVREADKNGIIAKRATLIRERYPKRSVNEIYRSLLRCIQSYDNLPILYEETKPMALLLTKTSSLSLLPMDRKSTLTRIDEIDNYPIDKSLSHDLFGKVDESTADYVGGVSKRVLPFEPAELRYKGLIEPEHGWHTLTPANVRQAVNASYNKFIDLNIPISSMSVLFESLQFLRRIADGHTNDLPKDDAVMEFVAKRVSKIYENIIESGIERLSTKRHKTNTFCQMQLSKLCCWKGTRTGMEKQVQFNENVKIIGNSAEGLDKMNYESTKNFCSEKFPTLNAMAKVVFDTPNTDDPLEIPDDMITKPLAHLYRYEKLLILENLQRLEQHLNEKVNSLLNGHGVSTKDRKNENNDLVNCVQYGVESVLTLPEKDLMFGKHITEIGKILSKEIQNCTEYE